MRSLITSFVCSICAATRERFRQHISPHNLENQREMRGKKKSKCKYQCRTQLQHLEMQIGSSVSGSAVAAASVICFLSVLHHLSVITELPGPPTNIAISNIGPRSVTLQFKPGYDGKTSISRWQVEAQVRQIYFREGRCYHLILENSWNKTLGLNWIQVELPLLKAEFLTCSKKNMILKSTPSPWLNP